MQSTDRASFYSTRLDLWRTLPVRQCTRLSSTPSGTSWPPAYARCVSQGPLTRSPLLLHRIPASHDSKSIITRTQLLWVYEIENGQTCRSCWKLQMIDVFIHTLYISWLSIENIYWQIILIFSEPCLCDCKFGNCPIRIYRHSLLILCREDRRCLPDSE